MWVDDLIIFGKDLNHVNKLKAQLSEEYEMKDMGELKLTNIFWGFKFIETGSGKSSTSVNQDTIEPYSNDSACRTANRPAHLSQLALDSPKRQSPTP
jgi:hypothetical protein